MDLVMRIKSFPSDGFYFLMSHEERLKLMFTSNN